MLSSLANRKASAALLCLGIAVVAVLASRTPSSQARSSKHVATSVQKETVTNVPPTVSAIHSASETIHATLSNFDELVLASDVPVLVDFYADWCGACRVQDPILDELAREVDAAKIVKVNVDEQPELAERYRVISLPTLLVFKKGQVVAHRMGLASKDELKAMLDAKESLVRKDE